MLANKHPNVFELKHLEKKNVLFLKKYKI